MTTDLGSVTASGTTPSNININVPTTSLAPGSTTITPATTPSSASDPASTIASSTAAASTISGEDYLTERPKYFMTFAAGDYNRAASAGLTSINTTFDTQNQIIMPLPEKIVDHHGITFDETPLGALLGAATNAILKTTADAQSILQGAATIGAGVAEGTIASIINNSGAGNVLGALGYSPNQFMTILLRGPQYKRHEFSWHLSPRNPGESQRLNKILNYFHNSAAPNITAAGFLFTFPKIWKIAFQPNSQYLIKFKPAVLTDVQVDYTAANYPSFLRQMGQNGLNAPSNIALTLRFLELEFWLSGNWQDNNDINDIEQRNPPPDPFGIGSTVTNLENQLQTGINNFTNPSSGTNP